jgi:hypothetical protein
MPFNLQHRCRVFCPFLAAALTLFVAASCVPSAIGPAPSDDAFAAAPKVHAICLPPVPVYDPSPDSATSNSIKYTLAVQEYTMCLMSDSAR